MKGWRIIAQVRKDKKKGKTKFCSKTMCTHNKWANEQTLITELRKLDYSGIQNLTLLKLETFEIQTF